MPVKNQAEYTLPVAVLIFFMRILLLQPQVVLSQNAENRLKPIVDQNETTVSLVYKDTLSVPSLFEFSVPVIMKTSHEISAMSLGFYYPEEYLEITGIEPANEMQGINYNATDGLINIVWSDVNPINITDDDTVITINIKSLDLSGLAGTIKLGLYEFSEFADQSANVIEGVVLEIPEIKYLIPDTIEFITGIYPNPFDEFTSINFYLKTESQVKISLFNIAGMEINQLTDAIFPEGSHQVRLYALDLSKGIYLLKFAVKNDEQSSSKVNKILSIR